MLPRLKRVRKAEMEANMAPNEGIEEVSTFFVTSDEEEEEEEEEE